MPERDSSNGIERRGVLAALATGLGGVGLARNSLARRLDAQDASRFVVEQGDQCIPITPLSGDETVEEFYDYRTPFTSPSGEAYSSYGTTDLQRAETSICFLYDGPQGLSLVVVHDELEDGTNGGAVTFRFDGLADGSWVVGDDDYDAPSNYDTFAETPEGWQVDWTWAESRSDGGAYRPLGDDFALTIDPAFNEAAELYGDPYEGEITDWQFLSGDRSDPERVSLALDQPLTIRAGGCGGTTTTTTRETTTEEDTTGEDQDGTEEETTEEEENDQQSSEPIWVELELEPRKVNPRSHGRLPLVVYSTGDFVATEIEPGSVGFGPEKASKRASPEKRIRTDADRDGRTDLKLHFLMDETGIDWDTDRVELTGKTADGREVVGVTDVQLVSRGGDDEDENEDEKADREDEDENEREEDEAEREDEADGHERDDEDEEEDREGEDDDEDEDDEDDEKDDEEEDDDEDDEREGRGHGEGRGNGRGQGNGRGGDGDE